MGQEAKQSVEVRAFPGLATEPDPNDLAPGASPEQVNATCSRSAALAVRGGLRQVSFEEDS